MLGAEAQHAEYSSLVTYWKVKEHNANLALQDAEKAKKYFETQAIEIQDQINDLRKKEGRLSEVLATNLNKKESSTSSNYSSGYDRGPWWTLWSTRYSSSNSSQSSSNSVNYDHSAIHTEQKRIGNRIAEQQALLTQINERIGKPVNREDIAKAAEQQEKFNKLLKGASERMEEAKSEYYKVKDQLDDACKKLGTDSVEILRQIEHIGSKFVEHTAKVVGEMVVQSEFTKFKLTLQRPTLISILPMLLQGMEFGDVWNLMNAKPAITYIVDDIYIKIDSLKKEAISGLNNAVLTGARPCIKDKPDDLPKLDLF